MVGALTRLDLPRGELAARLEILSPQRLRPPGATATRTFAVPTLERWYRLYSKGGLAALRPGWHDGRTLPNRGPRTRPQFDQNAGRPSLGLSGTIDGRITATACPWGRGDCGHAIGAVRSRLLARPAPGGVQPRRRTLDHPGGRGLNLGPGGRVQHRRCHFVDDEPQENIALRRRKAGQWPAPARHRNQMTPDELYPRRIVGDPVMSGNSPPDVTRQSGNSS